MYRILLTILAGSLLFSVAAFAEANWPQFHGPSAGVAEDSVLPASWSTNENVCGTLRLLIITSYFQKSMN